MDVTNMNRQSFYYHFRDTRDVLMWICQERVFLPLAAADLEFSEWIIRGLELLDQDRLFYLRVVSVSGVLRDVPGIFVKHGNFKFV